MNKQTMTNAKVTIDNVTRKFQLVIDWNDVTEDELQAAAQKSIVIAAQNMHRIAKVFPSDTSDWKIDASEFTSQRVRTRKTAMTPEQILATMSYEELLAYAATRAAATVTT